MFRNLQIIQASGSTSGGVSGSIAGHGAESAPDRSFEG